MITQLQEAIADIKMWRVSEDNMVILAPPYTLEQLINEEFINGKTQIRDCVSQPGGVDLVAPRFNGILFVEDTLVTQVIVKSLVSEHRVVVQR